MVITNNNNKMDVLAPHLAINQIKKKAPTAKYVFECFIHQATLILSFSHFVHRLKPSFFFSFFLSVFLLIIIIFPLPFHSLFNFYSSSSHSFFFPSLFVQFLNEFLREIIGDSSGICAERACTCPHMTHTFRRVFAV